MLASLKRITRSGWLNFYRNLGLSAGTIFIMVVAISFLSSLFILKDISRAMISILEEKTDISVYFEETAPEKDIVAVREEIAKIPEVKNVKYVSREEALREFIKRNENNPAIIESLAETGNPLLPALNIQSWQASQYEAIIKFFDNYSNKEIIKKVDYYERKPLIERIFSITSTINKIVILISVLLGLAAVFVAFNTIKMAIASSKEEISVMRLVGASNWFIRSPFFVQGAVSGFFAALASILIFAVLFFSLGPKFSVLMPGFNAVHYFTSHLLSLFFIQLLTGIGLGVISSAIAIRKYLKI